MSAELKLDVQHAALLAMDYQNEILARYAEKTGPVLDRAASVIAAARAASLPVMYIGVRFRPGYPEVSPRNTAFSQAKESGRMLEGTPGVEVHDKVAPQPGEPFITKRRVGAFSTTELQTILNAQGRTTLILMGVATSGVVLSTVRWAADADYTLIVVEDCCADADDEVHRVLTQKVFPRQATVVSSAQLIAAIQAGG